jgi:hypothetical protein
VKKRLSIDFILQHLLANPDTYTPKEKNYASKKVKSTNTSSSPFFKRSDGSAGSGIEVTT